MKKQNIIIIIVVLCIITLAVGYSIFRTNVEVSSKTAPSKNLEVIFTRIGDITQEGTEYANAMISENKKNVTISVPKMNYLGAYAEFPITIKNIGTLPARLESIRQFEVSNDAAIGITYDGIGIMDSVLKPNEERNFKVKVAWLRNSRSNVSNYEFVIRFNYIQG